MTGYALSVVAGTNTPHAYAYDATSGVTDLGVLVGPTYTSFGIDVNGPGRVILGADTSASAARTYYVDPGGAPVDLGTLGGSITYGRALNDNGTVAGEGTTADGKWHAFVHDGTIKDIGTLGGNSSFAVRINPDGQTVGYSDTASGRSHAFQYAAGSMIDLGSLDGADADSFALDINAAGAIVGGSRMADSSEVHAVLWTNGVIKDLNDYLDPASDWDYLSMARKISGKGLITGYGLKNDGARRAFLAVPAGQGNQ